MFIIVKIKAGENEKKNHINQQKRGEMTPYTLEISFWIPTSESLRKIIHNTNKVRKFVAKVAFCILTAFINGLCSDWDGSVVRAP